MSVAVHHILRQMQRDARLAWLIGPGSRTYELLTEEAATANSLNLDELRQQHEATLKFEPWPTDLQVEIDPETILLAPPEHGQTEWWGDHNRYTARGHMVGRHHTGACAPFWVGRQERQAALGGKTWTSRQCYYVVNDFGVLVEVPG